MRSGFLKNLCCISALLFGAGCGRYDYDHVFPFSKTIRDRSVQVGHANCFECPMTPEEFEFLKKDQVGRFDEWKTFSGEILYCGKLQIGHGYYGLTMQPVQYAMGKGERGWIPVIVYYPEAKKMLYFICDGKL